MSVQILESGAVIGGDYRVERLLSEGGMGAVYVAEQLSTGKQRALKVMKPELVTDDKSRQRFVEEAKVGGRIRSAHVVEVVGAGVDEPSGKPWLAMELLDGENLEQRVSRAGPLSPEEVAQLLSELAHALGQAHRQGVIHRDLKPENLFLATSHRLGAAPVLKVLDFGIASFVASDKTAATVTTAIGSPLWIAPEQTKTGAKLRPSTDVWAMGLIAFYLLTARSYWPAANAEPFNLHALMAEIIAHPLVAASERAAELGVWTPPAFDGWFGRCVVRDLDARFSDAEEAARALTQLGQPASASPGPAVQPTAPLPPPRQPVPPGSTRPMGDEESGGARALSAARGGPPGSGGSVASSSSGHGGASGAGGTSALGSAGGWGPGPAASGRGLGAGEAGSPLSAAGGSAAGRGFAAGPARGTPGWAVLGGAVALALLVLGGVALWLAGDDEPEPGGFAARSASERDPSSEESAAGEAAAGESATGESATGESATGESATGESATGEGSREEEVAAQHVAACEAAIAAEDYGSAAAEARAALQAQPGDEAAARCEARAQQAQAAALRREARAAGAGGAEPAGARPSRTERASGTPSETRRGRTPSAGRAAPSGASRSSGDPASLDDQVRSAVMRGDNAEVIRLLEGRARTERHLASLIEAYRARSQQSQAVRNMRLYVQRYPNTPRAQQYGQILARL